MWSEVGLCLVACLVIYTTHWTMKWRNPKCNGVLPPGSMGLPLIGETLSLITPSYSLDLHPFIKKRLQRYGLIFRTSLAGRPIVVSADPEFNRFVFQQEGKSVKAWYLDTFAKIFVLEGTYATSILHKYIRSIFLNHFGAERLKEKLLPEIEKFVAKSLFSWSSQESVEVRHAGSVMVFNFSAKHMIGYDAEKSTHDLCENYTNIIGGLLSFPLNIPGTAFHNCSKHQKKVTRILRDMLKERRNSPATTRHGDFLDQLTEDMDKEKFLTEDVCVAMVFGGLFTTFESVSAVLALAFSLLAEHPAVSEELIAEHEAIIKNREDPNSPLTWDEYKSMTFTLTVINETLRLANLVPGLLRKALKDISVNGFTIPKGWTIMVLTSALQLNPNTFEDPIKFNPWRWKNIDAHSASNNFMPFGGGNRQCAGAEFSRVFMSVFFHILVTKYRWTVVKGARIARNPILGFGDGIHIKFSEKKT